MITHAQLLEIVHYDPETGLFTLRKDTPRRKAGAVINLNYMGGHADRPSRQTRVNLWGFGPHFAGRLAWFYMTGEWPPNEIDHHDTDGWNQRWGNLRLATRSQNQANTRRYKSNTCGRKGVYRAGGLTRPYRAMIQKDKKRISLGRFETQDAAFDAYMAAAAELHGEFQRAA